MTEIRINGDSSQNFVVPHEWQSDNFNTAAKKIIIKPISFVSEVKIQRAVTQVKNEDN
jgi:hypothetical protein